MRSIRDESWVRRGTTLLWGAETLAGIAEPGAVLSIRQFFALAQGWPEELPCLHGDTLVVAGVEGCLDALDREDAVAWLEDDLRPRVLSFQEWYQGGTGLVLWLPGGRKRIHMHRATETYLWHCAPPQKDQTLELGRALWAGAETDVAHVLDPGESHADPDGPAWIGLFHPRIS